MNTTINEASKSLTEMLPNASSRPIGLYEKALPDLLPWEERLRQASAAGFSFVELSVDESEDRLARLYWTAAQRAELRQAVRNTGVPLLTIGLSAHRKYPLGSAAPETRAVALDLLRRAIELASDLGVRIIQLMGYDVFYEPSDAGTAARFLEGLQQGVRWAESAGVMLGLENVDLEFINSVAKALAIIAQVDSPWLRVYPDIGNLVAAGYDPISQLRLAKGQIVGLHVKDARPGEVRGVPFGGGQVPFEAVFGLLPELGFWGPLAVEMWAHLDPAGDPLKSAREACRFISTSIERAGSR